jgi:hypothetical protein
MMTGLHFLLTYKCLYECDHCFLYCGPRSEGTFTAAQLADAMQQGVDAGIDHIFLEGGEPFLYYPLMLEALRLAHGHGLKAGIVTNCYWATSEADAELWLRPLVDTGALTSLSVSDDSFHGCDPADSPARRAATAAARLGLPAGAICIDPPTVQPVSSKAEDGAVVGGGVMFRGRAADTLTADLPRRHFSCFDACPHEVLVDPGRLHVDAFGSLFVCQGICIGNIWKKKLVQILAGHRPESTLTTATCASSCGANWWMTFLSTSAQRARIGIPSSNTLPRTGPAAPCGLNRHENEAAISG